MLQTSPPISYEQRLQSLLQEELRRREAQDNLLSFTTYTKPDFEPSWHHELICEELEGLERGDFDRLMILAPPRHTKSELASRRFPAWYYGRHPDHQVIWTTYSAEFAADFGRDVRRIVDSPEYTRVFDAQLDPASKSANRWGTTAGGLYVSVGVGGPITGRGAHLLGVDDPFKNRQDADSEVMREMVWRWFSSTAFTRLMPGGKILIILTRWHEDDLAGRLLKQNPDEWRVVELKAEYDPINQRSLWEAWYPWDAIQRIKATIAPRDYQALYQQNPTPDEGQFFKRESIKRYAMGEQPERLNYYITSDFAVTESDQADYTEFGVWGLDCNNEWWLVDYYYAQAQITTWLDVLVDKIESFHPFAAVGERGVIMRAIEPLLKMRMNEREVYTTLEWIQRTSDKVASAVTFRNLAEMGKIHVPTTDWGERLVGQLMKFPAGADDDGVDVCSLLGMAVDKGVAAYMPEPDEPPLYPADYKRNRTPRKTWRTV